MPDHSSDGWEIIDLHTREEALAQGDLIEVPKSIAVRYGFNAPLAITRAVYLGAVFDRGADTSKDSDLARAFTTSERGQLRGICYSAILHLNAAGKQARDSNRLRFGSMGMDLLLHVGPDETGTIVFTIMTPEDD